MTVDKALGRRLIAEARLARYERRIQRAVLAALTEHRRRSMAVIRAASHGEPFDLDIWDCLTGDTPIRASGISHIARRWHEGALARITALSVVGSIEVTPHHPILTSRGWVRADEITPGDYLVGYRFAEQSSARAPDEKRRPTTIGEIFDTAHKTWPARRLVGVGPYLNGDRPDREVDVVTTDRELWHRFHPPVLEPFTHESLIPSDVCLASLFPPGPNGEGFGTHRPSPSLHRDEGIPLLFDGRRFTLGSEQSGGALPTNRNAGEMQLSANRLSIDAIDPAQGLERLAGYVSLHEVITREIVPWSGHVYDLTTKSGWMTGLGGLVVHNSTVDDEVAPTVLSVLTEIAGGVTDLFALTPAQRARVLGRIDVSVEAETFVNRIRGVGPLVASRLRDALTTGLGLGESVSDLAARVSDAYAFGESRSELITRTETHGAAERTTYTTAGVVNDEVPLVKTWLATGDDLTRETHAEADGQTVPYDAQFEVGDDLLDYPGDPAGSPEEVCNCRCTTIMEPAETGSDEEQAAE